MSEKEYLLSKISQVAGQINRHKNQQEGASAQPFATHGYNPYNYPPSRGISSYRGSRGRGRGRGGRAAPVHRNRTLVLNSGTVPGNCGESGSQFSIPDVPNIATQQLDPTISSASPSQAISGGQQWVAKRDRHMQLINSAVYDQQALARAKAMEATRQEKLKRRSERQKLKLKRFLERSKNIVPQTYGTAYGGVGAASSSHEVSVGGIRYHVSAGGNKLVKVPDDVKSVTATPKKAVVGGVTFIRSKSGNLWRSGLVKAKRNTTARKIKKPCKYFTLTGKCQRGLSCPYTHDPDRVAICPRFLQSSSCPEGDACDLSHDPTPHRVPACVHFLRGNCSNTNCRYAHIRVNPATQICKAFATEGYCEKGGDCTERHVHECPEFDEKGVCTDKKCKLPHIERAGRRRMAAAAAAASKPAVSTLASGNDSTADDESPNGAEDSDISSEDEREAINSDDVDSDVLSDEEGEEDCFIQSDDARKNSGSHEVTQQLDFIHF
ncbi:hypothetical protein BGX38DRAFT_1249061 [Terfezia claveryi]|nr:hypothetical protein BGX38DRAFT_1249061 [Terfezia claveryi]